MVNSARVGELKGKATLRTTPRFTIYLEDKCRVRNDITIYDLRFTIYYMNEWEWQLLEDKTLLEHVVVGGVELKQGDRVRLRPRAGGDVFDLALAGKTAVVEAIEQDYEGQAHLAVVVDDDPGRDLGMLRQPGHRFFFSPEEVEPVGQ